MMRKACRDGLIRFADVKADWVYQTVLETSL